MIIPITLTHIYSLHHTLNNQFIASCLILTCIEYEYPLYLKKIIIFTKHEKKVSICQSILFQFNSKMSISYFFRASYYRQLYCNICFIDVAETNLDYFRCHMITICHVLLFAQSDTAQVCM
jgi:hypothetical protein